MASFVQLAARRIAARAAASGTGSASSSGFASYSSSCGSALRSLAGAAGRPSVRRTIAAAGPHVERGWAGVAVQGLGDAVQQGYATPMSSPFAVKVAALHECAGSSSDAVTASLDVDDLDEPRIRGSARDPRAVAKALRLAKQKQQRLKGWTAESMEEAYAVQSALVELAIEEGDRQVGWKIGATSKTAQDRLGVSQPFFAPVMASDVVAVDAPPEALREVRTGLGEEGEPAESVLSLDASMVLGFECEFMVTLGEDLIPIEDDPFHVQDVEHAVSAVTPVIEVVGTRAEHDGGLHALTLIADSGGMSALVVPPHDLYTHKSQGLEWQAISVRSVLNNKVVGEGDCQDVLGHPVIAATWLANTLRSHGKHLRKGDVISTGTCTGLAPVTKGDVAFAAFDAYTRFGGIGPVAFV